MTDAELRSIVRNKITDGTLPRDRIGVVSATYGVDQACDACSASISSGQVLYKLTRRDSEKFIFHSECFVTWRAERNNVLAAEELEVAGSVRRVPTPQLRDPYSG